MLGYRELDWKLIGAVLLLSLIGILLIFAAQHHADNEYVRHYYLRQSMWLVIALAVFAAIIHSPLRLFDYTAYLLYGVSVLLLILVLFVGTPRMGAMRWFSFGPMNLAPADIAKVTLLFAMARFLAYTKLPVASKRRLAISAMLTAVPMMLILKQPDLGTSLVFPVMLFGLWFWSGLSPLYMILILSPLVSLVAASHWVAWAIYFVVLLTFLFMFRPGFMFGVVTMAANLAFGMTTPFIWNRLADYQKLRILTFLAVSYTHLTLPTILRV